jgi:hypothetical protein
MTFHSPPTASNIAAPYSWEDACLSPYETSQEEGRVQGRRDSAIAGMNQGYEWGQTTALSYGMEVGFMRGVVAVLENRENKHEIGEGRVAKALQSLRAALDDFPSPDVLFSNTLASDLKHRFESYGNIATEETDVSRKFERAQTRFKLLIIQLGLPNLTLQRIMEDASCLASKTTHSTNDPQSTERDTTTTEW